MTLLYSKFVAGQLPIGTLNIYKERTYKDEKTSFKATRGLLIYSNIGQNSNANIYLVTSGALQMIKDGGTLPSGAVITVTNNYLSANVAASDWLYIGF